MYFPHVNALKPNSNGEQTSVFQYQPRDYEMLKKWMLEVVGDMPHAGKGGA